MSRRHARVQLDFGSDSFLDIIANIVGILIILIVLAGMRVSKTPIMIPKESVASVSVPDSEEPEQSNVISEEEQPMADKVSGSAKTSKKSRFTGWQTVEAAEPVRLPSPELLQRIRQLKGELHAINLEINLQEKEVRQTISLEQSLQRKTSSILQEMNSESSVLRSERQSLDFFKRSLEKERTNLSDLRLELEKEKLARPHVEKIEHKMTPISHEVDGKEVHFRLYNGRIAYVPLEELIDRLRSQMTRQKNWLIKFHRHVGQVGPVDGFRMKYVMERKRLSALEELQHGPGLVRITLSEWQILPESDLETETIEEALQPSSAFVRALRIADGDATLTFWVYPDSYEAFRKLQKLAHSKQFVVAARPLPFGVSIAGSPLGSRSAGQ